MKTSYLKRRIAPSRSVERRPGRFDDYLDSRSIRFSSQQRTYRKKEGGSRKVAAASTGRKRGGAKESGAASSVAEKPWNRLRKAEGVHREPSEIGRPARFPAPARGASRRPFAVEIFPDFSGIG
jgi:hypothetical protein